MAQDEPVGMSNVLLVEDDAVLRTLLKRLLSSHGHTVVTADDGLAAVEKLASTDYDVVVTDMMMPRLDGLGLIGRAAAIAPQTEFIILTGHGSTETAVEAFKTGNVYDYLMKPLRDPQELCAAVDRAAERRRLREENRRLVTDLQRWIEELEAAKRQLAAQAERDPLTGLLNHRALHARLQTLLVVNPDTRHSVVLLDLDGFRAFNDTYGHVVGDQVLKHIGEALRAATPQGSLTGRWGADEFLLVLPGADCAKARAIAQAARERLAEIPFRHPDGTPLPLRFCCGIADSHSAGSSAINLLAAADSALFEAKQDGIGSTHLHIVDTTQAESGDRTAFTVLDGLVTAIDRKDRFTRHHSADVAGYALMLGDALGLSQESLDALRVAGLLHDVGKIGIPDSILRKPGRLSPAEFEVMKSHVTLSAQIIHGLPRLQDVLDGVLCHHERWDGQGYPRGLAGEQVPLIGRIMIIADAFSAMTLDRPYRAGMSFEAALQEVERCAGTQFDPELAKLFVSLIREQQRERHEQRRKAA
jgi:diguanylate cyclase (GGDEF)-like protein/putative nucleotidyltransferase with HDIG domain